MPADKDTDSIGKRLGLTLIYSLLSFNNWFGHKLNHKIAFWISLSAAFCLWSAKVTLFGLYLSGLALWASYKRPGRPDGIPLAPHDKIEVLLGRPIRVSTHVEDLHANNNVTVTTFKNQYVVAYRQSDSHFASKDTKIIVTTSRDLHAWEQTWTFTNGCDLRETLLFEMNGKLFLYFFSLEPIAGKFIPIHVFYTTSTDAKNWSEPVKVCKPHEVPWDIKVYGEGESRIAYKTSYMGDHYGEGDLKVLFERSRDGVTWEPCGKSGSVVYEGGVSEVAFEFTATGDLVAIGRNEDGDTTGFGTQLFHAKKDDLSAWTPLRISSSYRFDSPRIMRTTGGTVLLFARYATERYDLVPKWLPFAVQKVFNLIFYSCLSKSAAVYRILPVEDWGESGAGSVQIVRCFENTVSDTGFFSVTRELPSSDGERTKDCFVVANYSATGVSSNAPWTFGQMRPTESYVCRCRVFEPEASS